MTRLLSLNVDWSNALGQLKEALAGADLQVTQSFDLQAARASLSDPNCCPCPHHGTPDCTCQYLVLLVRHQDVFPISLVVHGHEDWTHISITQTGDKATENETKALIYAALSKLSLSPPADFL